MSKDKRKKDARLHALIRRLRAYPWLTRPSALSRREKRDINRLAAARRISLARVRVFSAFGPHIKRTLVLFRQEKP
jgi:hypothetical protein